MEFFAKVFLTGQVGGPVLDETGIQGKFDFSMDWAPDDNPPARPGDPGDVGRSPDPQGRTCCARSGSNWASSCYPAKARWRC